MQSDLRQFFDDIVEAILRQGFLPLEVEYSKASLPERTLPASWMRTVHANWKIGWANPRWLPGEQIYTASTPSLQDARRHTKESFRPLPPDVVRLKAASIRYGVDSYVGIDCYTEYVKAYFLRNPALYSRALNRALGNILEQFNLCRPGRVASSELIRECLRDRTRQPEVTRVALALSDVRWEAVHFADVVVAMVLYQASLIQYLSDLENAIETNRSLHIYQVIDAYLIIQTSFKPFESFLIFPTLLPLAILARHDLSRSASNEETEEVLREKSISLAWKEFFKANLLQTNFPNGSMICPASNHFWGVKDKGIVELFYRFVVEHRQDPFIAQLLIDVERVIRAALDPPRDYYYTYFLNGGSPLNAMYGLRDKWKAETG